MCEPTILLAAATGLSAVGQIQAGAQQAKLAKYQAKVEEAHAQQATAIAASEEERIRREGRRVRQQQLAQLAAAGLDPTTGSPLLLAVEAAEETELAALDARFSGRLQADEAGRRAALSRAEGRIAKTQGYFGAARTIAGGAYAGAKAGYFDDLLAA